MAIRVAGVNAPPLESGINISDFLDLVIPRPRFNSQAVLHSCVIRCIMHIRTAADACIRGHVESVQVCERFQQISLTLLVSHIRGISRYTLQNRFHEERCTEMKVAGSKRNYSYT